MAGEQTSFGTIVKKGTATIGNLLSVSGGGVTIDFVETTNHESPDAFREFRATLGSVPDITFKVQMTKANLTALTAEAVPGAGMDPWSVTWPFPTTPVVMSFNAQIAELTKGAADIDNLVEVDVTLKVSGKPTWSGLS